MRVSGDSELIEAYFLEPELVLRNNVEFTTSSLESGTKGPLARKRVGMTN